MMLAEWSKLPCDVLLSIFRQIAADAKPKTQNLYQCQLVCKGWSKAAQRLLYENVGCYETHNVNATADMCRFHTFIDTIKSLGPQLGAHVKIITVCNKFPYLGDPNKNLKMLFEVCPNIEELYTHKNATDIVWSCLLNEEKSLLPRLRSIVKKEEPVASTLYLPMAEKFKDSLVDIHLYGQTTSLSDSLAQMLHNLPSLKALYLYNYLVGRAQMCQMIDRCSARLEKLHVQYWLEGDDNDHVVSVPNHSVKDIMLTGPMYSSLFPYLANKFQALEKFKCCMMFDMRVISEEFKELCMRVKEYYVDLAFGIDQNTVMQCSNLTTAMNTRHKQLIFRIGTHSKMITLEKRGNTSTIKVQPPRADPYSMLTGSLNGGIYTLVHVKDISEFIDVYADFEGAQMSKTSVPTFTDVFKKYIASQSSNATSWCRVEESSNTRSWNIFNELIKYAANTPNTEIILESIIITDTTPETLQQEASHSSSIKQLTFTNAIIYHQMFPHLSLSLPSLDTLILDSCYIMMDDYYTVKLSMPSTKLRRLGLMVKPLPFATHLPRKSRLARSQLKNVDLSRVLSSGKQYTLRIEANGKEYLYNVESNVRSLPVKRRKEAICLGSQHKFLIWIQCSELKELSIVDGNYNSKARHQFIPLV